MAPGLSSTTKLVVETAGNESQRAADAVTVPAIRVDGWWAPAGVGATFTKTWRSVGVDPSGSSSATGSTSSSGVPLYPPSANARRPPSIKSVPPRSLTKSAIISSWSWVKKLASTEPRTRAR